MNEKTLTYQSQQTRRGPQRDQRGGENRVREGCAVVARAPRSRGLACSWSLLLSAELHIKPTHDAN